ncbi:MAG: hypothetical protein LUD81_10100 [Clostridiales bacterium]|nr:hypothetical protein [Clostridiales bacterium]
MHEKAVELLTALGYEMQGTDEALLSFCIGKAESTVKNEINWQEVPEGLMHIAVSMALGEFLTAKKTFDPAGLAGLDLSAGIKQLQEGDKNTVFSTGESSLTDEQRLDNYISLLMNYGKKEFSAFRRLRW